MGKFTEGVAAFRVRATQAAEAKFRKVVLAMDAKIVERTPLDTGAARGRWQPNIGPQPVAGLGGGDPLGAVEAMLPGLKLGDTAWLSNNISYIRVLEYGLFPNPPKHGTGKTVDGYSTQAPQGMVRIAASEFADVVSSA